MKHLPTIAFITGLMALSASQALASFPVQPPCHVPDSASTVVLFAAGVAGLLGLRRWMAKN